MVFAEVDYCYGTGPLRLRVQRIAWETPTLYDGETWYQVQGVEVLPNGTEGGQRQVLVRGRRLPVPRTRGR
jgi:hypothetical protein